LRYIRAGDIYQVNLAQRLAAPLALCPAGNSSSNWPRSPPPHFPRIWIAANFKLASSSPETFSPPERPAHPDAPDQGNPAPLGGPEPATRQLTYELQTSPKEMAELVMITDLLRNDLGRVCEYGFRAGAGAGPARTLFPQVQTSGLHR